MAPGKTRGEPLAVLPALFGQQGFVALIVLGGPGYKAMHRDAQLVLCALKLGEQREVNVVAHEIYGQRTSRANTPLDELPERKSLRITDCLDNYESEVISDQIFENCDIYGPAILITLQDVYLEECNFMYNTTLDSILWEVDTSRRPLVIGAVGLKNCTFRGCIFRYIGIAGPPDVIQHFRESPPPDGDANETSSHLQ